MLVSKIERTEIESKSQLFSSEKSTQPCWYQRQKELKLKANHNSIMNVYEASQVGIKDRKN